MTSDGALYDYFGGLADLGAGRVRFVGDAAQRIAEDYLRVLRFFRFHARYGHGPPDATALQAIRGSVASLTRLSAERVWSEIKRILVGPDPAGIVAMMRDCGVLAVLLPEAVHLERLAAMVAAGAPPDPALRLAGLICGDGTAVASRLRLSGAEAARVAAVLTGPALPDGASDDDVRRALADTPKDSLIGAAWLAGREPPLMARMSAMSVPIFPLRGRDLANAGVAPGPAIGELLRDLRAWWLAGGCRADAAACRAELARRLAASAGG
jgi:tRNA nucleotidyltransferase/poly(A) polymerase